MEGRKESNLYSVTMISKKKKMLFYIRILFWGLYNVTEQT